MTNKNMESVVHDKPLTLPVRNLENERLCDEFYDRASVALDRLHRPGMMNSEETNGFLVALACESSVADPEDYIGLLAGEEFLDNSSDANYDEYLGLLTEHMALIRRILDNGEIFIPLLLSDEPGEEKGNDWAHGFARCLAGTDSWKRLMDDEEHWQLLTPMLVLDTENDPLPDEPPRPPVTSELRQKLLASISISVGEIYKYFEPDRREEAAEKEYFPVPLPPIDPGERADLTRVDRLLGRLKAVGAVDLEALDGFLTAIICGPSTLQPQDAIPQIFGGVPISFPEKELREICDFIVRRYNEIAQTLDDGQPLQLIVRNNPAGKLYAEEWASGFALGMRMNGGRWEPLLKNGPRHALMPIFMLDTYAIENCPESERENLQDPAKRRVALSAVPASVSAIDLFFGPDRPSWTEVATVRRAEPKQGRNDPCACGSGKKYKKCCGA